MNKTGEILKQARPERGRRVQDDKGRGQLLIETLAALSIAVVVISAITIVAINALNNTQFSKNQNTATLYAQQGLAVVRKLHDSDWSGFMSKVAADGIVDYCLDKDSSELQFKSGVRCQPKTNANNFIREVRIVDNACGCGSSIAQSINVKKISVKVLWTDNKCYTMPTPTPTRGAGTQSIPDCTPDSDTLTRDRLFCHQVVLSSCLSDVNLVSTPGINLP